MFVQRFRYHHFEAFFEIYKMGMISEAKQLNRKGVLLTLQPPIEQTKQMKTTRVGFGRTEVSIPPF